MLLEAIRFATLAHKGQQRKYNFTPYILHPLRVMHRAIMLPGTTEEIAAAAVLHDVLEDCGITAATLEQHFGTAVATLVQELTNTSKSTHPHATRAERKKIDFARRATISPQANKIKLIDRIDNLREIPPTEDFLVTYKAESKLLLESLRGTDADLEAELQAIIR